MGVHSQHMSCGGNMEQGNEDDGLKILRKNRSKARMKYDKAKAKLQTNIEQQLTKKIPEAIQELKTAWGKLEETQDEYVLELHEADKSDEPHKQRQNVAHGSKPKGSTVIENNRSKARMKYDKAKAKLQTNIEKKLTKIIPDAIQELKTAWEKLEETQEEYVLELNEADKSDETDKINKEFSDLEIDKEKIVEAGEKLAPKSFVKDEPDEQRQNVAHGSKPKGTLAILRDVVENVGSTVSNLLGSIHVSKKKFQEFQTSMNDMLVSKW